MIKTLPMVLLLLLLPLETTGTLTCYNCHDRKSGDGDFTGIPTGKSGGAVSCDGTPEAGTIVGCTGSDNVCLTFVATYTMKDENNADVSMTERKSACGDSATSASDLETECKAAMAIVVDHKCATYKCDTNNCITMSGSNGVGVSEILLITAILTAILGML